MIKTTAPYQLPQYKTLELVVESEPIFGSDNYDPTSIPRSSNPVMAEERTHSQAREQRSSHAWVQNMDVDVLCKAQEHCVLCTLLLILSQKWSIQTVKSNIQTKLYIFFVIHLLFFWIGGKPSFFDESKFSDQVIFSSSEKIAKKF
jgi:hypothetical protein